MKDIFKESMGKIFHHLTVATVVFWSVFAVWKGYEYWPRDYHVDLYSVGDAEVQKVIHTLRNAREQDTVYLHVSSFGGSVKTMNQLINSIKYSEAHVVTISEAASISAGAATSLAGDEIRIRVPTVFMFHVARYLTMFGAVLIPLYDPIQELTGRVTAEYSAPYMTKDEIDRFIDGEDVWVQGEEMRARVLLGPKKENTYYFLQKYEEVKQQQLVEHKKLTEEAEQTLKEMRKKGEITKDEAIEFLNKYKNLLPALPDGHPIKSLARKYLK